MVKSVPGPASVEEKMAFDITLADVEKAVKRHPQMSALDLFNHLKLLFTDVREEIEDVSDVAEQCADELGLGDEEEGGPSAAEELSFLDRTSTTLSDCALFVEALLIWTGARKQDGTFDEKFPAELAKTYEDLSARVVVLAKETAEIREALTNTDTAPVAAVVSATDA